MAAYRVSFAVALVPIGVLCLRAAGLLTGSMHSKLLWILPLIVLATALVIGRRQPGRRRSNKWQALAALPFFALAFAVERSFIPIGAALGWLTFTFGDQQLAQAPLRTMAWALPACLLSGIFAWEFVLRRRVCASWSAASSGRTAFVATVVVGLSLQLPWFIDPSSLAPPRFLISSLIAALMIECCLSFVFLVTQSIWTSGIWRGLLLYLTGFVIEDWFGQAFPLSNFVEADPRIYVLRPGVATVSAVICAALALRVSLAGRREQTAS